MSKKLRPCKVCGQQIAKNAKFCPYCGGKSKKKHPLLALIVVIAIAALFVSILGKKEESRQAVSIPNVQIEPTVKDENKTEEVIENVSEDVIEGATEEATEEVIEEVIEESTEEVTAEVIEESDTQGICPEFKEAMDSYEEFFAQYCSFMEKYQENPTDVSLLADYAKFMTQYVETMEEMEALENTDMNDEELKYYLEVTARINQMLVDVAV